MSIGACMSGQRPTRANAAPSGRAGLPGGEAPRGGAGVSRVRARVQALLAGAGAGGGGVRLGEAECRSLLAGVVPFGPAAEAAGADEALAAARAIGYPVMCKLLDP